MHDTSENDVFWGYTQTDQSALSLLTWTECTYYIKRMRLYTS